LPIDPEDLSSINTPTYIAKIDCSENTRVANKLEISYYPTLILFKFGVKFEFTGELGHKDIIKWI
jgi:thioredoxin-like negative regulator of GroEL